MKRTTLIAFCMSLLLLPLSMLTQGETLPSNRSTLSAMSGATLVLAFDARIETKYDGFNRETVVTLRKTNITCGGGKGMESALKGTCVSIVASLHCPGVQLDYVRYAKLHVIFETKDWDMRHPLGERDLLVVADGETIKLGTMTLAGQDLDRNQLIDVMKEELEVSFPYQTFRKIALAQTVEMKVGKTKFELQEKDVVALRELNNRVKFK
jgi:hypothetical protein